MNASLDRVLDVLIVGAGPTGLTLACELLRRGVRCRIMDNADAPATTSRALGIQPRTMELFENMGIVDEIIARGGPVLGSQLYDGNHLLATIGGADVQRIANRPDIPYPSVWVLPQSDIEAVLSALLQRLGGVVEHSREFVAFRQDDHNVVATVQSATSVEEVCARWLIGCDGAHSRVRKNLGVLFAGSAYDEQFVLADVELTWNRDRDKTQLWFHRDGLIAILPFPNTNHLWRIFAEITLPQGAQAPQASIELFQQLLRERTGDTTTRISNSVWMSNFKVNRRMVDRYRVGRVFLAGDAAHIHSPFGGQGMNTGIQDAFNLAWKLALVIAGTSPITLLDTYQEERLPVAKTVMDSTDTNTKIFLSKNPVIKFLRERVLSLARVQAYLVRRASQLDVNYRSASLARTHQALQQVNDWLAFRTAPRAGDRAPQGNCEWHPSRTKTSLFQVFQGTEWRLLLFGGTMQPTERNANLLQIARRVESLLGGTIQTHLIVAASDKPANLDWDGPMLLDAHGELHKLYGAGTHALYLIRPDGYIGFRSQPVKEKELVGYLSQVFTLSKA